MEAERQAVNIRIRAERRPGELLKDLARAETPNPKGVNQYQVTSTPVTQPKPAKSNSEHFGSGRASGESRGKSAKSTPLTQQSSPYAEALETTGMARQTAHQFQKLAEVPAKEFEAALYRKDKS